MPASHKRKITGIIFDLDGVIVDTVPYHFTSWKQLFAEEGVAFTWRDYRERVNGIPRRDGIRAMIPRISQSRLAKLMIRKQRFFRRLIRKKLPNIFPRILSLLTLLQKRGYAVAIASSSENAPFLLGKLHLSRRVHVVVKGSDFRRPKPFPDIFRTAAKRLGRPSRECIVIEDAPSGVMAARRCNAFAIGLATTTSKAMLSRAGAHIVVRDTKALERFMKRFLDL